MIEYIFYPLIFLALWINSFLLHEFWHGLENYRQTKQFGKIGVSIKHLTMWHEPSGYIVNNTTYYLMGGLGSGATILLFSALTYLYVSFIITYMLWIVGVMNIVYGVYECRYLLKWGNGRKYKIGRYALYCVVIAVMVVIYWIVI